MVGLDGRGGGGGAEEGFEEVTVLEGELAI
jgi:hypothetical protein